MKISIRDTVKTDLPAIFRIRSDPKVVPFQYKLDRHDSIDSWIRKLEGRETYTGMEFKSSTILQDHETIGHIIRHHYEINGEKYCYCGWNLSPPYWGHGIAVEALTQQFEAFFNEQNLKAVISDCFSINKRCIRLMEKLNYESMPIPLRERIWTMVSNRCMHRILRFFLTRERWQSRNSKPAIQVDHLDN